MWAVSFAQMRFRYIGSILVNQHIHMQAADTQRLVRYIDEQVARAAKGYEVEALRNSIAGLRAQLAAPPSADGRGSISGRGSASGQSLQSGSSRSRAPGEQAGCGADAGALGAEVAPAESSSQAAEAVSQPPQRAGSDPPGPAAKSQGPDKEIGMARSHQASAESGQAAARASGMSREEAEGVLSPEQQAALLQALLHRVDGLEAALSSATALMQSSGTQGSAGSSSAPGDSNQVQKQLLALSAQVSDLQVLVHSLSTQLPAAAKAYEVDALKRSLADTNEALSQALRQGPAQPLNLTITLPIIQTPDPAAVVAAVEQSLQASDEAAAAQEAAPAEQAATAAAAAGAGAAPTAAAAVPGDASSTAASLGAADATAAKGTKAAHPASAATVTAPAAPADQPTASAAPQTTQQHAPENILAVLLALNTHFEGQKQQAARMGTRLSALEQTATLSDERGQALERQVLALQGSCQAAVCHLEATVPKLEENMAVVAQGVASVRSALTAGGDSAALVTTATLEDLVAGSAALKEVVKQSLLNMGIPVDDGGSSLGGDLPSPLLLSPSGRIHSARAASRIMSASAASIRAREAATGEVPSDAGGVADGPHSMPDDLQGSGAQQLSSASPEPGETAGQRPVSSKSVPADIEGTRPLSPARAGTGRGVRSTRLALSARTPRKVISFANLGAMGTGAGAASGSAGKPYGTPGFGDGEIPRHLVGAEYADTELAGIVHDLMHMTHAELKVTREGPLPGGEDAKGGLHVREAALRRLKRKPYEVQKHVEMLEAAKRELDRLVRHRNGPGFIRISVMLPGAAVAHAPDLHGNLPRCGTLC